MSDPFAAPYKTNDGLPLTATIPVEDANTFYAGPIEGSPQQPTFRKIMAADLPGGTPIFGGFSVNGAMYANSTDTIASTLPGAQYTSLVSNGTSTAPTFQPISLDQPAGLSGILGQAQGGTGTNTSTAKTVFAGPVSGANMLPTFRTLQQTDLPTINLSTSGAVSSQLPLANGGTAVDATNITQSYFFCGPENVPFISNPGPATFRAITINDVKDIASEIGLEMDSAAADYIVAKVNASASADNIAFRMSATGAATIASTMGVAGASTIAGNIPSTGADEIAGVMTSTGANSIAGKITSVGADAIAETMAGTGANIIAGNITSVGADAIAKTMGQPGADIIGNNMSTIGAEHIATTMGTVGADIIGANLTPPYETTVTDVTTLQTDVTALQADVTTLQGDVTALDADVVSLDTSVAGLTTTVGGLTTSVAGLTTSVGVIEGEIVTINTNLTILNAFQVTTQADLIDIYGQLGNQTGSGKIVKQRAPTITDSLLVTNDSLLGGIPPTINIYPQSGTAYDGYESHLYMANNTSVNYPSSVNVTIGIGGNSAGSRYRQQFFVLAPQMYIDAPVTITTPLGISSGGTGLNSTSAHFVLVGPTSGSGAPTWRLLTYSDISGSAPTPGFSGLTTNGIMYATSATNITSTSAGSQYQAMIANSAGAPTFQALNLAQSAAVSGTLAVANGGTGVTTSTGTGSNVLSASPTLTGNLTVSGGAGTALTLTNSSGYTASLTSSSTSSDVQYITNSATTGISTTRYINNGGTNGLVVGVGGATNATYPNQAYLEPQGTNGLVIKSYLSLGNSPTNNPGNCLTINNTSGNNAISVTCNNTNTYNSIKLFNDTSAVAEFGIGGSTVAVVQDRNKAFISATALSVNCGATFTGAVSVTSLTSTAAIPVTSGGTGVTTSTGTGSVVLSASPTFTGTISAAAMTLSTPLAVTSGGTGVTTSTGTGSNVLSASPTFTGTIAAAALTLTTPLAVTSGGTGVTTSTGTGSVVLSASPTLTGTETITTTTNVASLSISSNATVDTIQVSSSNTASQASLKLTNNLGNSSYFIQGGSTNVAPYTDQTVIVPSAKGLVIKSHVSLGDSPSGNPTNCLSINNTGSSNSINVTCNNANTYNSIQFYNDTSSLAEFGVGGSTVGTTQDRNRAFISASSLVVNCQLIQPVGVFTTVYGWQSGGFAYQASSGNYVAYPLGAVGYYYFGPSGIQTDSLTAITWTAGGAGTVPYVTFPYNGIYSVQWVTTTSPFFSPCFISKNGGGSNEVISGGPNWSNGVVAFQDGWGYGSSPGNTPGSTLNATVKMSTTDKLYFGLYESNAFQNTTQPNTLPNYWMLTFTLLQSLS